MNTSIIIPNYNGAHLLEKNLSSVFKAVVYYTKKTNTKAEIIVVDDGSTDNSIEVVKQYISHNKKDSISLHLVEKGKNSGFSSTVNSGVKTAKGEIVVLLNTDVQPDESFLLPLLAHFSKPSIFAAACMDKSIEDGKTVLRGRGIGQFQKGFLVHSAGTLNNDTTLWASGGSSAFRKAYWVELGGMDELFDPFYWEDIDLSYRALKAGYEIVFEKKSVVVHEHEKGIIRRKYSKETIKTIAYRNQFFFVWKNITDLPLLVSHVYWTAYYLGVYTVHGDRTFVKGFLSALKRLLPVIHERERIKTFYKKADKEVLEAFRE